ncbi:MAG: glycosyltransferase [Planctomycetes bacterium]|nr:glycosyltransferase [Planctomycetota bacterium]
MDRPTSDLGFRVSVVIPALADGAALRSNVPRVAALDRVGEIVVADAGGNESAAATLAACGARVVRCAPGRGPQLNTGAAAAGLDHLLFLHADCWLEDGAIEEALLLLAEPGVGAIVFRQQIVGDRRAYRWIEAAATRRAVQHGCPYGDSGLLLRRRDFVAIGGYPPLPLCEDLGLAKRLRRLGRIVATGRRIHVSARRWERHGVIRTTLLNVAIAWAFRMGVPAAILYRAYYGRALGDGADGDATDEEGSRA